MSDADGSHTHTPDPDGAMNEDQLRAEFVETVRSLRVLAEEMKFRQRGNSVLRTTLAFILIFGTAVFSSSAVSYCINATTAPSWCVVVPGSAVDARNANDLRITQLEHRVDDLQQRVEGVTK